MSNSHIQLHFELLMYMLSGTRTERNLVDEFGASPACTHKYTTAALKLKLVRRERVLNRTKGDPYYVYVPNKELVDAQPNAQTTQRPPSTGAPRSEPATTHGVPGLVLHR